MVLDGRHIRLRPATPADGEALAAILAEPEVARWWGDWDLERVSRDLLASEPPEHVYVMEHDGRIVGSIQSYEETEPEYRHANIDLFLGEGSRGRGLGPDAIRTLAAHLIDDVGHHRITIDPAADNAVAIRAYEKVGFRVVGVMRRYQRLAGQDWVDGLLMDLLADELVR